jgi:hypothetical protein
MMKYVFILAFIGVSLFASIQTSGIGFDYDNATHEERADWLTNQASITNGAFSKAIRQRHGINAAIEVTGIYPTGSSGLRGDIQLKYADVRSRKVAYRQQLKTLFCPTYEKLPIADHELRVVINMKDINGDQMTQFTLTPNECAKQVAKLEAKA